ncbi:hypothetical protein HaLaN_30906, partial [Haematococcus lacustris]
GGGRPSSLTADSVSGGQAVALDKRNIITGPLTRRRSHEHDAMHLAKGQAKHNPAVRGLAMHLILMVCNHGQQNICVQTSTKRA